ncbi:hypothetical protein CBR_g40438 [Chara braunii]|uniref:ABC transporter domain-containing protein n=1 Tax=Chara braunii TaxID=69332 RepID=A0A388LTX5_CHABU|nr:hypothetical protein CBR_g40438 [Chara braunii]|eukprot:GBG85709.1 hypothetical protein CBR_g40438 [Chara braunii]
MGGQAVSRSWNVSRCLSSLWMIGLVLSWICGAGGSWGVDTFAWQRLLQQQQQQEQQQQEQQLQDRLPPELLVRRFVDSAQSRGAVCNDESPGVYYIRTRADATKWIIFFEGEAACGQHCLSVLQGVNATKLTEYQSEVRKSSAPAYEKYAAHLQVLFNSTTTPLRSVPYGPWNDTLRGYNVLSGIESENPRFYNYNRVLLRYCSSDFWLGDMKPSEYSRNTSFMGSVIFQSIMKDLQGSTGIRNATEIILAGGGLGSAGALNHADWTKEQFGRGNLTTIKVLVDAFYWVGNKELVASTMAVLFISNAVMRPECRPGGTFEGLPCCMLTYCMASTQIAKEIPVFVVANVFDTAMVFNEYLSNNGTFPEEEVPSNMTGYLDVIGSAYSGAGKVEAPTTPDIRYLVFLQSARGFSQAMKTTLLRPEVEGRNGLSYFLPACLERFQLLPTLDVGQRQTPVVSGNFKALPALRTWEVVAIRNDSSSPNAAPDTHGELITLRDAITLWANATDFSYNNSVRLVDTCTSVMCNPTCGGLTYDAELSMDGTFFAVPWDLVVPVVATIPAVLCFAIEVLLVWKWCLLLSTQRKLLKKGKDHHRKLADVSQVESVIITFQNLSYWVDDSKEVQILHDVSGWATAGQLTAIMGPSGSGKSTLLELLIGRRSSGVVEGSLMISGYPLSQRRAWLKANTTFLQQEDVGLPQLTVRQSLTYSAMLRLPRKMSLAAKLIRVEQIIEEVGLGSCADTIFGGPNLPGLSGGQKRRLSIATELLTLPSVILLDEPTSGLDSASALDIIRLLSRLARAGRVIALAVHQPRQEIFQMFDRLILVAHGQAVFSGTPTEAMNIMRSLMSTTGSPYHYHESSSLPRSMKSPDVMNNLETVDEEEEGEMPYVNPADMLLDLLQTERGKMVLSNISRDPPSVRRRPSTDTSRKRQHAGWFTRLWAMEGRSLARGLFFCQLHMLLVFLLVGVWLGLLYMNADIPYVYASALAVQLALAPIILSPGMAQVFFDLLPLYNAEKMVGASSSWTFMLTYYCQKATVGNFAIMFLVPPIYWISRISPKLTDFFLTILILILYFMAFLAAFCMLLALSPSRKEQMLGASLMQIFFILFSGTLVPPSVLPRLLRPLKYASLLYYGFSAATVTNFKGKSYNCDYSRIECTLYTGDSFLASLGFQDVNVHRNMLVLLGFIIVGMPLSMVILWWRYRPRNMQGLRWNCSKTSEPKLKTSGRPSDPSVELVTADSPEPQR